MSLRNNRLVAFLSNPDRIRDIITFLIFLVFTTLVWFVHALNRNREVSLTFPVKYDNLSGQMAFVNPLPEEIVVKVRDTGSNLLQYGGDELPTIHIDVSNHIVGDRLRVTAEELQQEVHAVLRPNTTLLSTTPDDIDIQWRQLNSKTVPVSTEGHIMVDVAEQCVMTSEVRIDPAIVTIYGAAEVLDTINTLTVEDLKIQNLDDTLLRKLKVVVPNTVKCEKEHVLVTACARPFTERRISKNIHVTGIPDGTKIKLFPDKVQVVANVLQKDYAQVSEKDINIVFDYRKIREGELMPLTIESKTDKWFNIRITPSKVDYIIEK